MISHARLVLQATRYRADEPGYQEWKAPQEMSWTTRDALQWLTVNGAKAAGVDDVVGSLTPGKRADVVLLDMGGVSQAGWNRRDPAGAIIAQAQRRAGRHGAGRRARGEARRAARARRRRGRDAPHGGLAGVPVRADGRERRLHPAAARSTSRCTETARSFTHVERFVNRYLTLVQ